jgi:hypothetical protein
MGKKVMSPKQNSLQVFQKSKVVGVIFVLLAASLSLAWPAPQVSAQQQEGAPLPVPPGSTLRATLDGKTAEVVVAAAVCPSPSSTVVQYHEETIRVTGSGLPSPVTRVTFSDPAIYLVRISESAAAGVTLTVYAGPRAQRDPVDVTLHGMHGNSVMVPAALCVEMIDAAVWLIEGLQPTLRDGRFDEFDFDLSLQLLTADPSGRNGLRPLSRAHVAFGAAAGSSIVVRAVAETLERLDVGDKPWLITDGQGRVYVRVRADVRSGVPIVEARLGGKRPSLPEVNTEVEDGLQLVAWSADDDVVQRWLAQRPNGTDPGNDQAFGEITPDRRTVVVPVRSLVERVFEHGIVQMVGVEANRLVERVSDDAKALQRLIYVALVNSGVGRDPVYILIRGAVQWAQAAAGRSGDIPEELTRQFGLTAESLGSLPRAEIAARQALQNAVAGDADEIARIIYGALLLGELHGLAKAGFDQTVGTVTDLALWLKDYVDECRRSPAQTAVRFLRFQLRWNPVFGPAVQSFENSYQLYSEGTTRGPRIEDAAFQHFLDKALPYLYVAGQLPAAVPGLLFRGILAALESLPSASPVLDELLRHAAADVATFAEALSVRRSDPEFSFFAAGYLGGLGTAYVVGVIGTELLWFVATDGVATYVKGMVALEKALRYAKTAQNATLLIDGARLLEELRSFLDELAKVRRANTGPDHGRRIGLSSRTGDDAVVPVAWPLRVAPFRMAKIPGGAARRTSEFGRGLLGVFQVALHFVDDPEKLVNVLAPLFGPNKRKAAELLLELTDQKLSDGVATNRLLNAIRALEKIKTTEVKHWVLGMRAMLLNAADQGAWKGRTAEDMLKFGRELISRLSDHPADTVGRLIVASADIAGKPAAPRLFGDLFAEAGTDLGLGGSRSLTADEVRRIADRAARFLDELAQYDTAPTRGWLRGRLNGIYIFTSLIKEYMNDLSGIMALPRETLRAIQTRQLPELTRKARFSRIPSKQASRDHRTEFNQKRDELIAKWEENTVVTWPRYDKTLFKVVDDQGQSIKLPVELTEDLKPDISEQVVAFTAGYDVAEELKAYPDIPKHIIENIRKRGIRSKYVAEHKIGEDYGALFPGTSKAAEPLDAHHIVELEMGGENAWWNLIPLKNPHWHQGFIHSKVSKLREIMEAVSEYDILQLFD